MTPRLAALALAGLLAAPAAASPQTCLGTMHGGGIAVFAAGGAYRYELDPAMDGVELGAGLAADLGPLGAEATGTLRTLESDARLMVARGDAHLATPDLPVMGRLCITGGLGVARLSDDETGTTSTTLAAPVGIRLGTRLGLGTLRAEPFVQPQAIFASSSGEAFGVEVSHSAVGAGVDAGATLSSGKIVFGITFRFASMDAALGPHPGADTGIVARLGFRF